MNVDSMYEKSPRFLQIETTILCPGKCSFCPQKKVIRQPKIMEWWLIEKILNETGGHGIVYRPFLLNEPFTDPRMIDIVKMIKKDHSASVEFNTNAELLTPEISDRILDAGVDIMRFSVDGITKKTFNETRGLNFDRVYSNVKYFIHRAKIGNYHVKIELRMIRFPGTEAEQVQYKTFWEGQGASVVFTDLYRYPWEGQTNSIQRSCKKILREMFIYVNGRVTLCCWDTSERAIVGDINHEQVLSVWNGEKIRHFRKLLAEGLREKIPLCSRCDAYKDLMPEDFLP